MICFMLNNLRRPAGIGLDAGLQFQGLILDLDGFIAFARARTAEKRKASLFGIVGAILFDNLGIEHHGICRCSSTLIEKCDDAFLHANHICRHTDATVLVRYQRIKQVLRDL